MNCESDGKPQNQVTLKVNDQDIPLNAFTASMFAETVLGMLKPLRGVSDVQKVNLEIGCPKSS